MFTGLIEDVGKLAGRTPMGKAAKLTVATALPLGDVAIGDSIAVNGACLTVESAPAQSGVLTFHALVETLNRTNLGHLAVGAPLNVERAVRVGDRLGGHIVSGHVDATAAIRRIGRRGDDYVLTIELPDALKPYVIPKGSIAIDGISLTIAELGDSDLSACIIPHTWQATNLSTAAAGRVVNVETDVVGKYVLRSESLKSQPGVTLGMLRDAGF